MHFLDGDSLKPQSLTKIPIVDNYLRVFFSPEDYVIWSKIYPFDNQLVLKNLDEIIKRISKNGYLMASLKYKYFKLILEEADNVALTLGRIFCSLAENFYNFSSNFLLFKLFIPKLFSQGSRNINFLIQIY